jgi:hypothetical protein
MSSALSWSERANWGLLIGGVAMGIGSVIFIGTAVAVPSLRGSFLFTGIVFIPCAILMLRLGWGSDDTAKEDDALRARGTHAKATITAISPTGTSRHGRQEIRLQLRLEVPGKPPYLTNKTDMVPDELVPHLVVGRTISVHSDPSNTLKIAIDWDNLGDVPSPQWPGTAAAWPPA